MAHNDTDWLPHSLMAASARPALVVTASHTHAACVQPVGSHMRSSTGAAMRGLMSHTVGLSAGAGTFSAG